MCRDAEVLSLFATIINKLQGLMEKEVPRIFEAVFEVTLTMITKNFEVRLSPILCVFNVMRTAYAKTLLLPQSTAD